MAGWRPSLPIVLVLRLPAPDAIWLASVAARAGLSCFEVTATEADHAEALAGLRRELPDAELGVGSLRSAADVSAAATLGADFAVSAVAVEGGSEAAHAAGIGFVEGAMTPTEIHRADLGGADLVKVFPARGLGPKFVKDVLAPLPHLRLMASGGIAPGDISSYLEAGAAAVALGGIAHPRELAEREARPILNRLTELPV